MAIDMGDTRADYRRQANRQQRRREGDEIVGTMKFLKQQWDETKLLVLTDKTTVKVADPENDIRVDFTYRFSGRWIEHPKYGKQFHATSFATDTPVARNGVVAYLQQYVNGVGIAKASALYEAFGAEAIDKLRDHPEMVAASGIISLDVATEASAALKAVSKDQHTRARLFGLFKGRGLGPVAIQQCINLWGAAAADMIERDPFKLMVHRVQGAGFKRCDAIYADLGLPLRRLKRLMLMAWYELNRDMAGHTWFPWSKAEKAAQSEKAVRLGVRSGWLAERVMPDGSRWITERSKARDESEFLANLERLMSWRPATGAQNRLQWPAVETLQGLSMHQSEKLAAGLIAPVVVISGSPGTGKTHCIGAIVKEIVRTQGAMNLAVAAPTGKAAVRVKASMRRVGCPIEATTLHKLLGIGLSYESIGNRDGEDPMRGKRFIIVDESSMKDMTLAAFFLARVQTGTHVLIVGDPNQLPPVGHGCPLRDLIVSAAVPVIELTEIQRNAGLIVQACHAIKDGKPFKFADRWNPDAGDNLRLLDGGDAAETLAGVSNMIDKIAAKDLGPAVKKLDRKWDIQVLVAMNSKSPISRVPVNQYLQDVLNRSGKRIDGNPFRVGDKIICLKNTKLRTVTFCQEFLGLDKDRLAAESYIDTGEEAYIANGEIGECLALARHQTIVRFSEPARDVRVLHPHKPASREGDDEGDGNGGNGEGDNRLQFDLAYAVTVHKAQGSEWRAVIVIVDPGAKFVCCREHVYTAISRARDLCVLIGSERVLKEYCYRKTIGRRKTFLVEDLAARGMADKYLEAITTEELANGTTTPGSGTATTEHAAEAPRIEV